MEVTLRILLGIVALICLLGGLNLLNKGTAAFLPKEFPSQPVLDNLFRFLSGIYFGLGFLMAYVVVNFEEQKGLIYTVGLVVVFSGLGRFYSRSKVGIAGKYFENIMMLEILLGLAIIALQFLRG